MARPSRSAGPPRPAAEALAPGSPAAQPAAAPRSRWRLAFAASAVLLAAADTYVVVLALTSIMADVGVSLDQLQQATPIISGFLLGYIVVLPLLGRLSDLYGRQPVFLACLAAFAVGSVITATAGGLPMVVAGRTIQGLGGGGLVPVTLALVADMWAPGRRGPALGVVGAVQELGSVLGPLYGAVIVALSGWRAIFWINVPVAAILGAAFALCRAPHGQAGTAEAAPRQLPDLCGPALLAVAATAGCLALTAPTRLAEDITVGQLYAPVAGGSRFSALTTPMALTCFAAFFLALAWEALAPRRVAVLLPLRRLGGLVRSVDWPGGLLLGGVLACLIVAFATADPSSQVLAGNAVVTLPLAGALAALFIVRELRCADPLVDFGALRDRAAGGSLLVNLAVGAGLMAALVDVPIFARATQFPDSQVQAALVLVRLLAAVPLGAVVGGVLCERLSFRATAGCGMLLSAAMFTLMTRWSDGTLAERASVLGWEAPLHGSDVVLGLCGLGFGLVIAPVNAAVLAAVRASLHGLASALVVVARMVGMLVGLALLTALGLRRFYEVEAGIPSPAKLCPATPSQCPAYDAQVTAAVIDELHVIFAGAAVACLVAALLAAALLRRPPSAAALQQRHGLLEVVTSGG